MRAAKRINYENSVIFTYILVMLLGLVVIYLQQENMILNNEIIKDKIMSLN